MGSGFRDARSVLRTARRRDGRRSDGDPSRFLCEAGKQRIVITRHGKPAGVRIGFDSEDDWFEYRLETARVSCAGSKKRARALRNAAFASKEWMGSNGIPPAQPNILL